MVVTSGDHAADEAVSSEAGDALATRAAATLGAAQDAARRVRRSVSVAGNVVMLLAGFINIRLAALLPWKQTQRRAVLVRLQWLYLVGKCLEDLPQLAIAATYLAGRGASGELSGSAVGTAVLNMVISGASFLLTLIWLGLQVADSSNRDRARASGVEQAETEPEASEGLPDRRQSRDFDAFGGNDALEA